MDKKSKKGTGWVARLRRRWLVGTGVMLTALLSVTAVASADCKDWAHQYNSNIHLWGMHGHLYTNNPTVDHPSSSFSLAHLYAMADFDAPDYHFVETGWYKGYGKQYTYSVPHYYYVYTDTVYHEVNIPSPIPKIGSTYAYTLEYYAYDSGTGKYGWQIITPAEAAYIWIFGVPNCQPLAGAEVSQWGDADKTKGLGHGKPDFFFYLINTYIQKTWNYSNYPGTEIDAFSVIDDKIGPAHLTFTPITQFTEFTVTGTLP